MVLCSENEVKKWLRNLAIIKKELELKMRFYREITNGAGDDAFFRKHCIYYREQIEETQNKLKEQMSDVERLFGLLCEDEKLVMTARYITAVKWDYIERYVFYSRRQAIRLHNEAVKKLVGCSVGE